MKIFISADIEGITGVVHWDEAMGHSVQDFTEQMTREVSATCHGAAERGVDDILVKDAHGSGRNINLNGLPMTTRVLKGWSEGPLRMMEGLDSSFDAVMFVGYHSGANMGGNPLAHTFSNSRFQWVKLNDAYISEFDLNAMIAHYYDVPVIFLSGDQALCSDAQRKIPGIRTVSTMEGLGDAMICIHPEKACEAISQEVGEAIKNLEVKVQDLPLKMTFDIAFKESKHAYKAQFYPGVTLIEPKVIQYVTEDFMDFLTMFMFI